MAATSAWEPVPAVALAVYAHPNNPEVGCGGTLARWAAAGCAVHVVVCCQGDKGSADPATDPAALAALRADESLASSVALGAAQLHLFGLPDGELDERELWGRLVALVRQVRPDVVLCPDPTAMVGRHYWKHRDHRVVGTATLDAVAPAAAMPLYLPEAGPAHRVAAVLLSGTPEPDVWVDVSAGLDAKAAALACHASQLDGSAALLSEVVRSRAEEAGRAGGLAYAEAFRALELPA